MDPVLMPDGQMNRMGTAKALVANYCAEEEIWEEDGVAPPPEDFYVVWFCKTLQNWKALISTDSLDGTYFEVTYNGDKNEAYVDHYDKAANVPYALG